MCWTSFWLGVIRRMCFFKNGLVDELKKALSERILNAELDEHLDIRKAPRAQATTATAIRRSRF